MDPIAAARRLLADAVETRVFPAATVDVGSSAGPLWQEALGTRTFDRSDAVSPATPFDLASLTKAIAAASIAIDLVGQGRLSLDERVEDSIGEWRGRGRETVTIRDLLEHASGLPARLLDAPPQGRREFEHEICAIPLEYAPGSKSVYSDLDFILLGFLLADRAGAGLDACFDRLAASLGKVEPDSMAIRFNLPPHERAAAAPTRPLPDDLRRGRLLVGEVHDNYAAALGGVAGHSGLFGSAIAVGAFARAVLRAARGDDRVPRPWSPPLVALATTRTAVPGSSRALGWDRMLPTSSCGTRMSSSAFGHPGFTGTSLWIDPARDRYFVLLTNRVCDGGTQEQMREVRRAFHDALADL
ncbi:MAG: serine hydrolase domain-containing protein [Betaproteobacteria bacterium]